MSSNEKPTLDERYPLPEGVKVRKHKFGTKPVTPLFPVHTGQDAGSGSSPTAFRILWEDAEQGLSVVVRERPDGRLVADARSTDASRLDKAAISVALMGTVDDGMIHKLIPLKIPEENGCSGSADFGPLATAVKELGPEIRAIVYLVF